MTDRLQPALAFLRRDLLRNIVALKMLDAYPDAAEVYMHTDSAGEGVLVLLPTSASPFDRRVYPYTDYVVLLSATHLAAVRSLLAHVPTDRRLVFKLASTDERRVIEQRYELRRATAYISYTAPLGRQFTQSGAVVSGRVDERCYELYRAQGYERDEVEHYFSGGRALSFAIYRGAAPVAACFAYPNVGHVYEIGAVYTLPEQRRRGHARALVETALHTLVRRGCLPRYQVHEDNQPSIQLAQALGLEPFVVIEHWLYDGRHA